MHISAHQKEMGVLTPVKDFHNLMRNIHSFSDGQASVAYYDDTLELIKVCIRPSDGFYKDAEFIFSICPNHKKPTEAPEVRCLTQIYHPNIDTLEDDGDLCLSLFEEWESHFGLEDVVQGLLFLLYNPNLEDALCPIFSPDMTQEEFATNVKRSLNGEEIEGYTFPKNRNKVERTSYEAAAKENSCSQCNLSAEIAPGGINAKNGECHGDTKDQKQVNRSVKAVVATTEGVAGGNNDRLYSKQTCDLNNAPNVT